MNTAIKPRTFQRDLENLPAALLPLTRLKHWVIWKWEQTQDGKWTKVPYQPRFYNEHAKSNSTRTWGSYAEAVLAFTAGHCDGIGFMLRGSELGAIDLDKIRDFATGQVLRWAEELFVEAASAGCYLEWTVSGTGARIIGIAKGGELHRKIQINRKNGCAVEFYRHCTRFITISGMQISGDYSGLPVTQELPDFDRLFDLLFARFCDDAQRPAPEACEFIGGLHIGIEEIQDEESSPDFFDFNNAGPQDVVDYQDLIENGAPEGTRSEEFHKVVWHLAAQGKTEEEIAEELEQHPSGVAAKYAGRLLDAVRLSYRKWQAHRQATVSGVAISGSAQAGAATAQAAAARPIPVSAPWPQIRVIASELPRVIAEAEAALLAYDCEIYQRGATMVRPVLTRFEVANKREAQGWQLIPVTRPWLVNTLTCAARFWKYNGRSSAWTPIDCPDKVADTYLSRRGGWKLPVLAGIIHHPFLRADGSICEAAGYDSISGLLFKPEGERYPPIPLQPNKSDAVAALGKLVELIREFPFVQGKDRAVALSAILTTLDRRSMVTAPLHAFTAPTAGTGKSLLIDACAVMATGREMPVTSQGGSEEEFEKRLGAHLLAGDMAISLDNCDREVGGPFLCQVLTQRHLSIRILGLSRNAETPVNATIFANGNNLVIAGDTTRRALLCAMDAGVERPETREFSTPLLLDAIRRDRGDLVVAALTVLRAWHVSGERIKLSPFGSFEEWSYRIREPLVWLGQVDPHETVSDVRKSDPRRDELIAVLMQWQLHLGENHKHTVQQVIERAVNEPTFYTALMGVAASRTGQTISNVLLGRWLKRVEGNIANGLTLKQVGIAQGYPLWMLKS